MDSKTPDNSGDLFGDLAEPALLTSKNSGKFRWTATKTRNKSLRACKNSGKFGIVLKKLGQVPGSPSISSPRILFFGFSLAVAGHIAFVLLPPGQGVPERPKNLLRDGDSSVYSLMWPSAQNALQMEEQLVLGVLQTLRFVQLAKMVKQSSQKG